MFDQQIDPQFWYDAYITTYVERDVRQILQVQDTHLFQRFLQVFAVIPLKVAISHLDLVHH